MKVQRLGAFARKQTALRLKRFVSALRFASENGQDPEAIHDLRVSIRRLQQCLRLFGGLLADKPLKRLRRRLRKWMDLCAAVRNYDVAEIVLRDAGATPTKATAASLLHSRGRAQAALFHALEKSSRRKRAHWEKDLSRTPHAPCDWNPLEKAEPQVHRAMVRLASKFLASGEAAIALQQDQERLHRFRLRTKRFRYTLEIVQPFYGTRLKPALLELRKLQDQLGAMSDDATTLELIRTDRRACAAVRNRLRAHQQTFAAEWDGPALLRCLGDLRRWADLALPKDSVFQ